MSWLVEDPLPIIVAVVLIQFVLVVVLYQTGRGVVLVAMAAVLVLGLVGLAIEWVVVTDRERVSDQLQELATAVERGDVQRVLASIDPQAAPVRADAQQYMDRFEIDSARLHLLSLHINQVTNPATARVRVRIAASGRDLRGQSPWERFVRTIELELREENERWVIHSYRLEPYQGGMP